MMGGKFQLKCTHARGGPYNSVFKLTFASSGQHEDLFSLCLQHSRESGYAVICLMNQADTNIAVQSLAQNSPPGA